MVPRRALALARHNRSSSGSRSGVTSKQIVAGQMWFAAEIRGVAEARNAGRESLVAAFAKLHDATDFHRCAWQVAQLHIGTARHQHYADTAAVRTTHETQPPQ